MFKTRTRKILRDVWARKGRTALVSLAIFIGVTGTIALFSMSNIIINQLRTDIKENELAMGRINVAADTGAQLENARYLELLGNYPGVTEIMGGLEDTSVYFKVNEDDEKFEDGLVQAYAVWNGNTESPDLLTAPFETPAPIEPLRLLEGGNWPMPGENEVVVEQRMADEFGLDVGDTVYFRILSPSREPEANGATGTLEVWTVTGIVFDPYSFAPKQGIYADLSNANYLTGRTGFGFFWVQFTDYPTADDEFDDFLTFIAKQTPYTPAFSQKEDPAQNSLITSAQTITSLMSFLALVSLIVSGFLVVNVITSLVTEQKRQIGVMKSMGATRFDNFYIYSGIAFTYGLIGIIPGVLIGIPAGNAAAHALAPQVNTLLEGFKVSPPSITLGIIVGLLVPVLASVLPVFNGTRVQILDAMTDLGIDANYGTGPLARLIGVLPIPITIRQGLSNVSLKKSRLAFTVITLAIAIGAFMGIYALFASLTDGIQLFIDSFNVQLAVFPSESRDPQQFENQLLQNFPEDITRVEPGMQLQVEFEGYDPGVPAGGPPGIFAYGYDIASDHPAFNFEISEGKTITEETKNTGIILSSLLAANMDKTVGDAVVLRTPGGSKELNVVGIADFPLDQCWIHWETLSKIAGYTFDTIQGGSSANAMIPQAASTFIKYASVAQLEGRSDPLMILGMTPSLAQYLSFEAGSFFSPNEAGIIISSVLATESNIILGDYLSLKSMQSDGITAEYPVVGIFDVPPVLTAGADIPAGFAGMFWRDLAQFDGATIESVPAPGAYFVTTPLTDPTANQLGEVADDMNDTLAASGSPVFILNFVELTDQISEAFVTIQVILSAVAGLIGVVGALGLLTTLSMSVFERQKEIGVMRSIGAGSSTVAAQFLTEGLVVGVISWIVGLPLMVIIQVALLSITGFSETFPFEFSLKAAVIGLVGMLAITTVASLWPSLGAARKTVSDILRYQ